MLKWIGNKQRFAETIVSYMPQQFNNYYEPFLGSGAVMAELLYSDGAKLMPHFQKAYGSDILPFLVDIFILAKENPELLTEYYKREITEYYLSPEKKYNEIKQVYKNDKEIVDALSKYFIVTIKMTERRIEELGLT